MTIAERNAVHLIVMQRALDGTGAQVRVDTTKTGARVLRWVRTTVEAAVLVLWCALSSSAQIIDHTSYPLFDQMPPAVLQQALATRVEFADRSVGVNVWDGFRTCLAVPYTSAPSSCRTIRTGLTPEPWTPLVANVTFHGWVGLGLPNEMAGCNSEGLSSWQGYLPCWRSYITPRLNDYDVIGLFPDYTIGGNSNAAANFYTNLPGSYDAYDLLNFELSIAPKKVIWYGVSIPKADQGGSLQRLADFNAAARTFAAAHGSVFLDIGDIESHCWDGSLAVNANGVPIQCADWGSETSGGHLTYGHAKVRMAKYVLIATAIANGWNPFAPPIQPLTISCPSDQTVQASSLEGAIVNFPLATTTGGVAPVVVTPDLMSGGLFPIGTTTVTQTATDAQPVSVVCTFTITVSPPLIYSMSAYRVGNGGYDALSLEATTAPNLTTTITVTVSDGQGRTETKTVSPVTLGP